MVLGRLTNLLADFLTRSWHLLEVSTELQPEIKSNWQEPRDDADKIEENLKKCYEGFKRILPSALVVDEDNVKMRVRHTQSSHPRAHTITDFNVEEVEVYHFYNHRSISYPRVPFTDVV